MKNGFEQFKKQLIETEQPTNLRDQILFDTTGEFPRSIELRNCKDLRELAMVLCEDKVNSWRDFVWACKKYKIPASKYKSLKVLWE